jgi:hypothetical protein
MFLKIGVILIIILLIKIIANQQELDFHLVESKRVDFDSNEMIHFRGIINKISAIFDRIISEIKYNFKHSKIFKKES